MREWSFRNELKYIYLQCLQSDSLCWWHWFLMRSKRSCLNFSAVIITHLCTASTFFTLLSWLPTYFKDTFPDAKVNQTMLFQTVCENICVKAKEYQSVYWDFSSSVWEKQSPIIISEKERAGHVSMMLLWLNSSRGLHITSHQSVCLIPIHKSVYYMHLTHLLFIACSCVCLHVCFPRVGCLTWSHGLWPSLRPCLVAAFQTI